MAFLRAAHVECVRWMHVYMCFASKHEVLTVLAAAVGKKKKKNRTVKNRRKFVTVGGAGRGNGPRRRPAGIRTFVSHSNISGRWIPPPPKPVYLLARAPMHGAVPTSYQADPAGEGEVRARTLETRKPGYAYLVPPLASPGSRVPESARSSGGVRDSQRKKEL